MPTKLPRPREPDVISNGLFALLAGIVMGACLGSFWTWIIMR